LRLCTTRPLPDRPRPRTLIGGCSNWAREAARGPAEEVVHWGGDHFWNKVQSVKWECHYFSPEYN